MANYFETSRPIEELFLGHRIREDDGDLHALIASIRLIGFIQPITITPEGAVISGGRRLQAARALGCKTVDVWVRTDITTELGMLLAEQQENENRLPYTRTEQARFYRELKRILGEDAAHRQHATRFGAPTGEPESGAPAPGDGTVTGLRPLQVSKQAALIVTGTRSDYTLEHVVELLELQDNPAISGELRTIVNTALGRINQKSPVEPLYLRVKAAQDTEQLYQIAADPETPAAIRDIARLELHALPVEGRPQEVRRAASAALQRATAAKTGRRPAEALTRQPPATVQRYAPRALSEMVADLDYWWLHYDPAEVARALTDEQWEQLADWTRNTARFLAEAAAHRSNPAA